MTRTVIRRYLYLRIRIYAISYTSQFPNKIFVGLRPAAATNRHDRSINVFYHDSSDRAENFVSVFSRNK
jgi:hypothetical protein